MKEKPSVLGGHRLADIHVEINRLRRRDGHEEIGGLGLAMKLVSHFHESHNPRVAEALANLSQARATEQAEGKKTGQEAL